MNVLIYRWKVFNQEDVAEAFRDLGFDVIEYEEPTVYIDEDQGTKFHDTVEVTRAIRQADVVFSFNYFAHVSDICEKLHIPYLIWTLDSPLISLYHESIYNLCNYIFIFDKFFYYQIKELELQHVYYLPLAVNAKRINDELENFDNNLYKSDISFVGGMYHRNSYDSIKDKLPKYLQEHFLASLEEQLFVPGMDIIDNSLTSEVLEELLELTDFRQSKGSFSDLQLVFTNTFLGFKLANMERVVILNALAAALTPLGKGIDLYTDESDANLKGINVLDTIDYRVDMPKVFRNSKINLNITLRNIRSGIPLRVWDVLGCGGFLLTNYQIELPMYFREGRDLVTYTSIEDCINKTLYYLEHEKEREEIAMNGYKTVKKYHSYLSRVEEMLEKLGE